MQLDTEGNFTIQAFSQKITNLLIHNENNHLLKPQQGSGLYRCCVIITMGDDIMLASGCHNAMRWFKCCLVLVLQAELQSSDVIP